MPRLASPTLEIAKRELLENVLSWRFALALALSTLILVTSVVALAGAYREDHDAYLAKQREYGEQQSGFVATLGEIHRHVGRPNVLGIFVGGPGDEMRTRYGADGTSGPAQPRYEPQGGNASPTNARFDPLDLGFVGAVVLTFLAVLFSYDAVSGEKERGTLKLVLANPVPRDAVLLGKYLGGLASVLAPFFVGLLVSLATLPFLGVGMGPGAWVRLGAILAGLLLLLSAFYLLGLLVSALSRRSSTALLGVSLVWLVLVFGVGNGAAVVAKAAVPAPSNAELFEKNRAIDERLFAEWERAQQEQMATVREGNSTGGSWRAVTVNANMSQLAEEAQREREAVRADAMRRLDDQIRLAESVGAASPVEAFRSLATGLARSDYWSFRDLLGAAEEYQREVERQREEWARDTGGEGPAQVIVAGPGGVREIGTGPQFVPPTFDYRPPTVSDQLATPAAVRDLLVLVAYNLAAFVAAYVAFLRYDVR